MQQLKQTKIKHLLLASLLVIIALGAALRIYRLGAESVWLDESFSVDIADGPLPSVIEETAKDVHPPLYYLLLHYWMELLGDSEFSLRLLSVIFGVLAILAIYKLASLLFDRTTGLLAALLLALSHFNIEFSQEARMYMLLSLLGILSMYFFVRLLSGERKWVAFAGYVVASALMTYTHVYSFFILAAQNLYLLTLLFTRRDIFRRVLKLWVAAQVLLFVLFLPWLSVLLQQVAHVRKGFWIPKLPARSLIYTMDVYAGSRPLALILFPLVGLAVFLGLRGRGRPEAAEADGPAAGPAGLPDERSRTCLLLLWFLCPVLIPFAVSQFSAPIFLPKYTLPASAAFIVLATRGFLKVRFHQLRVVLAVLLLYLLATDLRGYYRSVKKDTWREAVATFSDMARPGDVVLFNQQSGQSPFDYYYRRGGLVEKPFPDFDSELRVDNVAELLKPAVEGKERVWLVISHPTVFTPLIPEQLSRWYDTAAHWTEGGVEIYLFEKHR